MCHITFCLLYLMIMCHITLKMQDTSRHDTARFSYVCHGSAVHWQVSSQERGVSYVGARHLASRAAASAARGASSSAARRAAASSPRSARSPPPVRCAAPSCATHTCVTHSVRFILIALCSPSRVPFPGRPNVSMFY